jgi:hypothetical protein
MTIRGVFPFHSTPVVILKSEALRTTKDLSQPAGVLDRRGRTLKNQPVPLNWEYN